MPLSIASHFVDDESLSAEITLEVVIVIVAFDCAEYLYKAAAVVAAVLATPTSRHLQEAYSPE
jgi:hypothetical protein